VNREVPTGIHCGRGDVIEMTSSTVFAVKANVLKMRVVKW
jgi:hypothetical protein